jgi:hypothetical protein
MYNLKTAYEERDLAQYDSLLAPGFVFYLSPDDIHIAESLGRQVEIESHTNLFDADLVEALDVSFEVGTAEADSSRPDPLHPGQYLWTLTLTQTDLYIFGKAPMQHPDEPPGAYQVEDATEQFWLRRNGWQDPDTGERVWTIVEWRELSTPWALGESERMSPSVEHPSWGQVKFLFR